MDAIEKKIIRQRIKYMINCNEIISLDNLSDNLIELFEKELEILVKRRKNEKKEK